MCKEKGGKHVTVNSCQDMQVLSSEYEKLYSYTGLSEKICTILKGLGWKKGYLRASEAEVS